MRMVIGGGFAAVQFAKTLRSELRAPVCKILLFGENHIFLSEARTQIAKFADLRTSRF